MKKVVFLLLSGVFMISCTTMKNSQTNIKDVLLAGEWVLQDENGTVNSYNGQPISMNFTEEDGLRASGFAGCNRYFAGVNIVGATIQFEQAGSTMMACPEMDSESAFLKQLPLINTYEVSGNELRFYNNKILLLKFKRAG
ncbi:MAG: META domain-containing protein [Weeksellaceae bacterium]